MITTQIDSFYHFYPALTALVGTKTDAGTNFMAAAWTTGLSFDPPLFGVAISPRRHTHGMIEKSGAFTCNFLGLEHLKLIHACGRLSGRDVDKVTALKIPLEASVKIACPTIESAYAAYECVLRHQYPVGDHDLFVGQVVAIHTREEALKDGILDARALRFTLYQGNNRYLTTDPESGVSLPAVIPLPGDRR